MKNIIVVLVLGVASFGAAACSSSSSPVSPSADARLSSTAAGTPATDAKPGYAAAAKPGALTIIGIVLAGRRRVRCPSGGRRQGGPG